MPMPTQMKCPYDDCPFEGTEEDVDSHIVYMTTVVKDREHDEDQRR